MLYEVITARRAETTTLRSGQQGVLSRFIVEPFVAHAGDAEYYISAVLGDMEDVLTLSAHGGINIEDNWDRVSIVEIPVDADGDDLLELISAAVPAAVTDRDRFALFACDFYRFFRDLSYNFV